MPLPILPCPFRAPSHPSAHRRAHDAAIVTSRGLIRTAWCLSVVRAPRHFDLSRWFFKQPQRWHDREVCVGLMTLVS